MKQIAIIWLLYECGSPQDLVSVLHAYGFEGAAIKLLDGELKYNVQYGEKKLIEYVDAIKIADPPIEFIGWGYHYTDRPGPQGDAIEERRQKLGFTKYYLNVEKEFKEPGAGNDFVTMVSKLKIGGLEVLVCSYRFPLSHSQMPWERMDNQEAVDGWAPQVYWALANNPIQQTDKCVTQYQSFSDKKIEPMGPLFGQNFLVKQEDGTMKSVYWEPKVAELVAFREHSHALEMDVSYFRLCWAIKRQRWDLVEAATGYHATPPPPPPPPPTPSQVRICNLVETPTYVEYLRVRRDKPFGDIAFYTRNGMVYYVNGTAEDSQGRIWYSIELDPTQQQLPALYIASWYTEPVE